MNLLLIALAIFAAGIFILQIVIAAQNYRNARSDRFFSHGETREYFQIKYRVDLIIAIALIITGVAAFYGFDTSENIKSNMREEFTEMNKGMENFRTELDSLKETTSDFQTEIASSSKEFTSFFQELEVKGKSATEIAKGLESAFIKQQRAVNSLRKEIETLKTNEYLQKNIFLIDKLRVVSEIRGFARVEFDELRTPSGQRLPVFKSPPFVLGYNDSQEFVPMLAHITSTTNEFFEIENYSKERVYTFIIIYPIAQ